MYNSLNRNVKHVFCMLISVWGLMFSLKILIKRVKRENYLFKSNKELLRVMYILFFIMLFDPILF